MNKLALVAFVGLSIFASLMLARAQLRNFHHVQLQQPQILMRGFCHEDPNNKGFFVLKFLNEPGWKEGDQCYGKSDIKVFIANFGKDECFGGTLEECTNAGINLHKIRPCRVN